MAASLEELFLTMDFFLIEASPFSDGLLLESFGALLRATGLSDGLDEILSDVSGLCSSGILDRLHFDTSESGLLICPRIRGGLVNSRAPAVLRILGAVLITTGSFLGGG